MRVITLAVAALYAFLTSPTQAAAEVEKTGEWLECSNRHPAANQAIIRFCEKEDIVVPSDYGDAGKAGGADSGAGVWITGHCWPPQWVPKDICLSQFHHMCVMYQDEISAEERYGGDGCQEWSITYSAIWNQVRKYVGRLGSFWALVCFRDSSCARWLLACVMDTHPAWYIVIVWAGLG